MRRSLIPLLAVCLLVTACQSNDTAETETANTAAQETPAPAMMLMSTAFEPEGMIPMVYTCDSLDISPPLTWSNVPEETQSLALIADDPDAPGQIWVHWVVYNIPPETQGFEEAVAAEDTLVSMAVQGMTDFGRIGYGGPCPPSGVHRYFFKLYALDTTLTLEGEVNKHRLIEAMEGHVIAETQLMGKYSRKK
jgi:Raf kinase inhibitor-like YbhB/YbcL family protein